MLTPGGTTARGLGWAHQQDKQRLLAQLVDGTPCPLPEYCGGQPMYHPARCPEPGCFYCTLQRDHVIPRALGGTHGPARLTHAWCNLKRSAETKRALQQQHDTAANGTGRRPW